MRKPSWEIRIGLAMMGSLMLVVEGIVIAAPFSSVWPAIISAPFCLTIAFLYFKEAI